MPFELTLKNYFWIQTLVLLLGFSFLLWRPRSRRGFTLKMNKGQKANEKPQGLTGQVATSNISVDKSGRPTTPRELQVFFNYNGHTFEAYEVLGLPAGISFVKVEAAFKSQLQSSDAQSRPFLEAAFKALKASQN